MQLTHTDLKPENILFVNSDSELEYDPKTVSNSFLNAFEFKAAMSATF